MMPLIPLAIPIALSVLSALSVRPVLSTQPGLSTQRVLSIGVESSQQPMSPGITGSVRDDETGRPITGAVVSIPESSLACATDTLGKYVLSPVPAGEHRVSFRAIGYARRSIAALVPREGLLTIHVSLRPEPIRLSPIDVHAPIAERGLDEHGEPAFPDRASTIAAVRNYPVLAEPDVFQALGGGEVALRPESPEGLNVRGGASDQIAYLLDGIPVFHPHHAAGVFSAWNPDALLRLRLASSAPSPSYPAALSGTIAAATQRPGSRHRLRGSASTTQARVAVDGPLPGQAGYLASWRKAIPGLLGGKRDRSHVRGESSDWLVKLEVSLFGGRARLLGYEGDDEVRTAAARDSAQADSAQATADWSGRRNLFEWHSRSYGAEWIRRVGAAAVRLVAWRSEGAAGSDWLAETEQLHLDAWRRDLGLLAAFEHAPAGGTNAFTSIGARIERQRTSCRVDFDSAGTGPFRLASRAVIVSPFAQHARDVGRRVRIDLALAVPATGTRAYAEPRAQLRWRPRESWELSGSVTRLHQFAQSLRNPESVVGNVFPADVFAGSGAPGVPVARSDQAMAAVGWRPTTGLRFGAQAYTRRLRGLVLVAPREGGPFATVEPAAGTGDARGLSLEAALSARRLGAVLTYGLQRVRFSDGEVSYQPEHGAVHSLEGGVLFVPADAWSVRLSVVGAAGRRATAISRGFEWEACNLLDRGCEFAGNPYHDGEKLGGSKLPPYLRLDLGLRRSWRVRPAGRDGSIALFATVTNLLGRRNLMTYVRNRETGKLEGVEMRPLSPLVVGLDWEF